MARNKVGFVIFGILVLGIVMVGFSLFLPKQTTSCTTWSSETVCIRYYVSGGYVCSVEVSPSQGEVACTITPSFWQLTRFWAFDFGMAELVIVIVSALMALVSAIYSKQQGRKKDLPMLYAEPFTLTEKESPCLCC